MFTNRTTFLDVSHRTSQKLSLLSYNITWLFGQREKEKEKEKVGTAVKIVRVSGQVSCETHDLLNASSPPNFLFQNGRFRFPQYLEATIPLPIITHPKADNF